MRTVMLFVFLWLGFVGWGLHAQTPGLFTIDGQIRDKTSGELLAGATVFVKELSDGAVSNAYGFYSISMKPGVYHLRFSYVGYQSLNCEVHQIPTCRCHYPVWPINCKRCR